jgi:hypothetical protein
VSCLPRRSAAIAGWLYASLAALALVEVAAGFLLGTGDAHFRFEDIPAWGSIYGLVSCVAIIVVSKVLGKLWLTRPENYWSVSSESTADPSVGTARQPRPEV